MTIPSSWSLILWISVFSMTSPSAVFGRLRKTSDFFGRLRTSSGIFGNDRVVFNPRKKISRLYLRKSWQVYYCQNITGNYYMHGQKNYAYMYVGILFQAFQRKPKKLKSLLNSYLAVVKLKKLKALREVKENQCSTASTCKIKSCQKNPPKCKPGEQNRPASWPLLKCHWDIKCRLSKFAVIIRCSYQ